MTVAEEPATWGVSNDRHRRRDHREGQGCVGDAPAPVAGALGLAETVRSDEIVAKSTATAPNLRESPQSGAEAGPRVPTAPGHGDRWLIVDPPTSRRSSQFKFEY